MIETDIEVKQLTMHRMQQNIAGKSQSGTHKNSEYSVIPAMYN